MFDPLPTHPKRPFPCHGGVSKHPWRCLDQATHLWTDRGGLGDLMVGFFSGIRLENGIGEWDSYLVLVQNSGLERRRGCHEKIYG